MSFAEALAALRAEAAAYPDAVQMWMRVMSVSYFAGIVLALINRRALWIVAAAAGTGALLILGKMVLPELPRAAIGGPVHLVLWPLAMIGLWWTGPGCPSFHHRRAALVYSLWAGWVTALMMISLLLDAKEVVLPG